MTPAIRFLKSHNLAFVLHEYTHDATNTAYGMEAAEKLGVNAERVFKTLILAYETKRYAVAVIPVSSQLNLKQAAILLRVKKVELALPKDAEKVTGYIVGGISPIGQKKQLPTLLDESAFAHETLFVSGGRRGLDIEITAETLQRATQALHAIITHA